MNKNFFHTFLHTFIIMTFGFLLVTCDIYSTEEEHGPCSLSQMPPFDKLPSFTDFGCEEGYFIYMADMEKVPWTRNRNFVSVEFHQQLDEEQLHEILDEYDLFYHSRVEPTRHVFARVKSQPAEVYYTSYGDSTQPTLGNRPEVKYALPVFMNEFWQPLMITDRIRIRFENLDTEQETSIIDSLITNDHLIRGSDGPGDPIRYTVIVTKLSTANPLVLSNNYSLIQNVRFALPDYALMK
jgi:hypothetical protein